MLAHRYNNERVEYAANDESKWVHDRCIMRVITL